MNEKKEVRKKISLRTELCAVSKPPDSEKKAARLYADKMKMTLLLFLPRFEYLLKMSDIVTDWYKISRILYFFFNEQNISTIILTIYYVLTM